MSVPSSSISMSPKSLRLTAPPEPSPLSNSPPNSIVMYIWSGAWNDMSAVASIDMSPPVTLNSSSARSELTSCSKRSAEAPSTSVTLATPGADGSPPLDATPDQLFGTADAAVQVAVLHALQLPPVVHRVHVSGLPVVGEQARAPG